MAVTDLTRLYGEFADAMYRAGLARGPKSMCKDVDAMLAGGGLELHQRILTVAAGRAGRGSKHVTFWVLTDQTLIAGGFGWRPVAMVFDLQGLDVVREGYLVRVVGGYPDRDAREISLGSDSGRGYSVIADQVGLDKARRLAKEIVSASSLLDAPSLRSQDDLTTVRDERAAKASAGTASAGTASAKICVSLLPGPLLEIRNRSEAHAQSVTVDLPVAPENRDILGPTGEARVDAMAPGATACFPLTLGPDTPPSVVCRIMWRDASGGGTETAELQFRGIAVSRGWYPDPFARYERRYWNGSEWTVSVQREGVGYNDPPG